MLFYIVLWCFVLICDVCFVVLFGFAVFRGFFFFCVVFVRLFYALVLFLRGVFPHLNDVFEHSHRPRRQRAEGNETKTNESKQTKINKRQKQNKKTQKQTKQTRQTKTKNKKHKITQCNTSLGYTTSGVQRNVVATTICERHRLDARKIGNLF